MNRQSREQTVAPLSVVWSGDPLHGNDHNRSMPFEDLAVLLDADAWSYVLQPGITETEAKLLSSCPRVTSLGQAFADFEDTAAVVSQLDLVITVDTSVAHLAGALGCPTWVLLPSVPHWRWGLNRDDCPWYPSVRLFRQGMDRDWTPVVASVGQALATLLRNGSLGIPAREQARRQ